MLSQSIIRVLVAASLGLVDLLHTAASLQTATIRRLSSPDYRTNKHTVTEATINRVYHMTSCATGVSSGVSIRICFDLNIKVENG